MAFYAQPRSLDEALAYLGTGDVTVLAGGTDYYPSMVDRVLNQDILDTSRIDGLSGISRDGARWRLGGSATWTNVIKADLPAAFDALKDAARQIGSIQIQNVATVAGNLCNASPAADGVPPLLVLDAEVELSSSEGVRTLPLEAFIQGNRHTDRRPEELLTAIYVPADIETAASAFEKLGARDTLVISIVSVAALVALDRSGAIETARIAVGACSEVPCRLPALEGALAGHNPEAISHDFITDQHLGRLTPIDDIRASAAYRLDAVREMIARILNKAAGRRT